MSDNVTKHPVVTFTYKKGTDKTFRRILVYDYDDQYLTGLDLDNDMQYKKFRVDSIVDAIIFEGLMTVIVNPIVSRETFGSTMPRI